MKKLQNEYYIENNFATLSGPYNLSCEKEKAMLSNVIKDMMAGDITHRITSDIHGGWVERTGMILTKAKSK